jgi:hypothetical protein
MGFESWFGKGARVIALGAALGAGAPTEADARGEVAAASPSASDTVTPHTERVSESVRVEQEKLLAFIDSFYKNPTPQREAFALIANSLSREDVALFKKMTAKVAKDRVRAGGAGVGFIASEAEFGSAVYAEMIRASEHDISEKVSQIASLSRTLSRAANLWLEQQANK